MRRAELEAKTKQELLDLAREMDLPGRSRLSKDGLIQAIMKRRAHQRRPAFSRPAAARKRPGRKAPPARAARTSKPAKGAGQPAARGRSEAVKASGRQGARTRSGSGKAARPQAGGARSGSGRATRPQGARARSGSAKAARPQGARAGSGSAKATRSQTDRPQPAATKKTGAGTRGARKKQVRRREARPGRKRSPYGPAARRLHGGTATPLPAAAPPPAPGPTRRGEAPRRVWGAPLEMPERYGRSYAALMARDPYWLFAYWEVAPQTVAELETRLKDEWRDHRWVLRVFTFPAEIELPQAEEGNGEDRYDIELPPGAASWYINVGRTDHVFRVAIGIVTRTGTFYALARSNAVRTPRDAISPVTDEEWTRAPETYQRLYEFIGDGVGDGGGSAELGMLLRERLQAEWSSGQLGSMGSGAFAKPTERGPGFWFTLDAELIIYGATEPDARVTVQGRRVALRPDGTFSLRFLLPDGTQVIDATAVSADGAFRKTITPTVRRETSSTETIEEQVGS